MSVPYAGATSGESARKEITKILRSFGCSSVGFMDQYERSIVLLQFEHRGRSVRLEASAQGWANLFLKHNPWNKNRKSDEAAWRQRALDQGMIAVNSILRDWVKGQVTAIETGILSFEAVFLPHMIASDGRPLLAHMAGNLLPAPTEENRDD
jgi:hypothetical protein